MIKLLLVGGFKELLTEANDTFIRNDSLLIGDVENTEDALKFFDRYDIDCVAVKLTPPASGIYDFIATLSALRKRPSVIVINTLGESIFAKRAADLGAGAVLGNDATLEGILQLAAALCISREMSVKITKDGKTLDERLATIFIAAGVPPHIKGYQYLREAVKAAMGAPEIINNITKSLYPAVARRFNTSPSKVERAIRHAIDVAYTRGKIENINQIYGIKIFNKGDKPTNGELIALVSDKMIIECG